MNNNDTELMLSTSEAHAYLQERLSVAYPEGFSPHTLYRWIRAGAFPNLKSTGEGHARRISIPVSDLDNFDPEAIKGEPGRPSSPDAPWHGYRDMDGKEQWELQRQQRKRRKRKETGQ